MISDEVKQAIRKGIEEEYGEGEISAFTADKVWRRVEAKLSPNHPPKEAICWVQDDDMEDEWELAMSAGNGWFYAEGCDGGACQRRDHYRRIPTAQDAVEALKADGGWGVPVELVQRLIDNAEEG